MLRIRKSHFSSSVAGLVAGAAMLAGMILVAPENALTFLNLPGLLIVTGGTVAATLVCRPLRDVRRVLGSMPRWIRDRDAQLLDTSDVDVLLRVAELLRHGHIREAEATLETATNPLVKHGAQLVLDRANPQELNKALEWHLHGAKRQIGADISILRTMAGFAPAFGMLGTLFGLIHMLSGLDAANLTQLGHAMAFAITTTLYGIVLANLILKPLSMKLEHQFQAFWQFQQLLKEGVLLLHARQHPILMRDTLVAFAQSQNLGATEQEAWPRAA